MLTNFSIPYFFTLTFILILMQNKNVLLTFPIDNTSHLTQMSDFWKLFILKIKVNFSQQKSFNSVYFA